MKRLLLRISLFLLATLAISIQSYGQWNAVLVTEDDSPNGPGYQVPSMAVIDENSFVALCVRTVIPSGQSFPTWDEVNLRDSVIANYLVGYSNPSDTSGRMTNVPYASVGLFTKWVSGFDEVQLYRAYKTVGTPDSLVYVANNDPNHNILVFRLTKDSVESTDYRLATDAAGTSGSNGDIMGLAVDNNGYVYVLNIYGSTANTQEVRVYKGIKTSPTTWGQDPHTDTPIKTIDLPQGVYRGLTVSPDGKQLFVSSMTDRNVVRYLGAPTTGYSKDTNFNFALTTADTIIGTMYPDSSTIPPTDKWDLGKPLGMAYLSPNNLLFVTAARWLGFNIRGHGTNSNGNSGYTYSKVFMVNPNNGARMDSLDKADYYYQKSDTTGVARSYTSPIFGAGPLHISGYASTYDVAFDKNKDMYSQSFYCWTVERWHYTGTLPTVTVVGVHDVTGIVPAQFSLAQNYPNPFNPTTTIQFALKTASHVEIILTNTLGQKVATLADQDVAVGTHEVVFDASKFTSGVYFYTMRAGSFIETKKMILAK